MICHIKYMFQILIAGMGTILLPACTNCTCERVNIWGLHFNNYSRATDSFAKVEVYPKNMDYGLLYSSTDEPIGLNGNMSYHFDFDYDYKITILPAGKTYRLEALYEEVKTKKTMNSCDNMQCAYSYKLNSVGVNQPEEESNSGNGYISVD